MVFSLRRRTSLAFAVAVAALVSVGCGGSDDDTPLPNVVQLAKADSQLGTLAAAIEAADLSATLSGNGPFTVFAPTDQAFAALLTELGVSQAQLLADKALLAAVLKYHVLPASVTRAQVLPGRPVTPVEGGYFKIDAASSGALSITDGRNRVSQVVRPDQIARNGIVHVIDKVLLPPNRTVVETAQALAAANPGEFTVLVEAVVAANLAGTLNGTGPFTVFAPTDAAFAALLAELGVTKAQLLADVDLLTKVLTYHVVSGLTLKAQVPVGTPIPTVQGETFTVDANLAITDRRNRTSNIVQTDVLARNGVIHVIDKVLLPAP